MNSRSPHTGPSGSNPWRDDWDERARRSMRLYVATWHAHSDETWSEGARRDARFLMDWLPEDVGAGDSCLDLGCGPGRLLPFLAERFERVVGCDVSPEMLAHATSLTADDARIETRLCDGRSLAGLPDGGFRFVLCSAVFIHLDRETIRGYLAEVGRVLAPGGLLVASFNSSEPAPAAPPAEPPAGADEPLPPPAHPTDPELELLGGRTWDGVRFTRDELVADLQAAGLPLESCELQGDVWLIGARRQG